MSDFAIEYRDMHKAIHHIIIVKGSNEPLAQKIRDYLDDNEQYVPDQVVMHDDFVEDIEIDFQDRPTEYDGETLEYITSSSSGRYAESVDVW